MNHLLAHGGGDIFGPFSVWTFVLRFGEIASQSAPTLLTGLLLAGALRTRLGQAWLSSLVSGAPSRSLLRASIFGVIAPVGALGALPVATEMVRANVRPGNVLCFLVVAPLFMPWSVGYAGDSFGLTNTIFILLGGVALAYALGLVVNVFAKRPSPIPHDSPSKHQSQLIVAVRAAAGHCAGALWIYVFLSISASAAFAAVLEAASIESHLGESAITTMFELAVPLSIANLDSDTAIAFASEFWRIGLLPGGMVVAVVLGAGWSIGTLAWCVHRLGRLGIIANVAWLAVAMCIAVIGNNLLLPTRAGEADSHGFDVLTKPHNVDTNYSWGLVGDKISESLTSNGVAVVALMALAIFGLTDRFITRRNTPGRRNHSTNGTDESITTEHSLPGRVVLISLLLLLLIANIYSYYPPTEELYERLRLQNGNLGDAIAILDNAQFEYSDREAAMGRALNALDQIDRDIARIQVSRVIRGNVDMNEIDTLSEIAMRIRMKLTATDSRDKGEDVLEFAKQLR